MLMRTAGKILTLLGLATVAATGLAGTLIPIGTALQCGPPFLGGLPKTAGGRMIETVTGLCSSAENFAVVVYCAMLVLGGAILLVGAGLWSNAAHARRIPVTPEATH
ncbi:hypothetical protein [Arthrobacter sp. GN70]|uniref:Uncharacterized protein n=1 Tax=Arthrobacter terricola TaxID=2547396 RepID=A0A4R5KE71_9MICC|nr:hypothetical protein [Arthrobacter sp. GN70]MBT8162586.1 hypothetical protein [Arthrobacter sp. GN70]TDF92858.1 hypothetical protein E1809_17000 [Arthrobacter terricola]